MVNVGAAEAPIPVATTAGGVVAEDGTFTFEIGGEGELRPPLLIDVAAPDGKLVHSVEYGSISDAKHPLALQVDGLAYLPIEPDPDGTQGERMKLAGRVIDETGKDVPGGLPIVLWGVPDGTPTPAPRPLVVTATQTGGYFSGDWVPTRLSAAHACVAGSANLAIRLDDGRLPQEMLLALTLPPTETIVQPRPPVAEPADLTGNPSAFSQDLGPDCAKLTTPNRSVEEFTYTLVVRTTEPDVQGLTLAERATVPKELLSALVAASVMHEAMNRGAIAKIDVSDLDDLALDVRSAQMLAGDDDPPTIADIKRSAWLSEVGWAKDLLQVASFDPPVRQLLDADHPVDWDATPTIYQAVTIARGHLLEFREVWRADGYSLGDLLQSLPLAPGQRRQLAIVDWERRSTTAREESLDFEERLRAMVGRNRDVAEIVGASLSEDTAAGSRNSTWGAAGGIGGGFIGSGWGIFGGVSGGASGSSSSAWQESSRRFASDSMQTLRDRVMQRASALRDQRSTVVQTVAQGEDQRLQTETLANYNHCHSMTVEYFEVLRHYVVTHELADVRECLLVPMQMRAFDAAKALRWQSALLPHLRDSAVAPGFDAIRRVADNWEGWDYPLARYSEEAPQVLEGELWLSFVLPRPRDKDDGTFQLAEWQRYVPWIPYGAQQMWGYYFVPRMAAYNVQESARRDAVFREQISPQIAKRLMDRLRFAYVTVGGSEVPVVLDVSLMSRYAEGVALYLTLHPRGPLPATPREQIAQFKIWLDAADLPPDAQLIVHGGKVRYQTEHKQWLLFSDDRIMNDLSNTDPVFVRTPLSTPERRDPRQEDRDLAARLVDHLNTDIEYYHQAIWTSMDVERRFMLLDGILVPGLGGKSVASVVENRLIGLAGNSLIFPLAPGMRIDPQVAPGSKGALLDLYAADPPPPVRVSVPTRGVYAEAMLGDCNGCEEIDDARYWRWSTAGMLAPPSIAPVSTASRADNEDTLKPTPLPTPLVSIQNAPALPNPPGLGDVFKLLATPNLFTDITGLAGTQKNAKAAFDDALSTASGLAQQAAQLARQNLTAANGERMLDRIYRAQQDGLLAPDAAGELSAKVFGSMVGAPDAKADKKASSPVADPAVQRAIDKAAQGNKGHVNISSVDETIEVSFQGGAVQPSGTGRIPVVLEVVDRWIDQPVIAQDLIGTYGASTWRRTIIDRMSVLKAVYPAATVAVQNRFLRAKPGDNNRFQFLGRLRIVYPAQPGAPDRVAGRGRLPLVVLIHGHHDAWTASSDVRNHDGYAYLQEHLATQGIVSVAVDCNAANLVDAQVDMRAQMTVDAIDYMRTLSQDRGHRLHRRIDFDRVGLMGHSRGGEAVVAAATLNAAQKRCVIRAVAAVAPTDVTGFLDPSEQLVATSANAGFLLVLYGGLDGDVSGVGGARTVFGTGFRHYDRATAPKAMVYVPGCTHNRFNSVWNIDEFGVLPADLQNNLVHRREDHEQLMIEYVGGLFEWKLNGNAARAGLFNGSATNTLGLEASLQWAWGSRYKLIDNFEDVAAGTIGARTLRRAEVGAFADVLVNGTRLESQVAHQASILALEANLTAADAPALELTLPAGHRDWSGFERMTFGLCTWVDLSTPAGIAAGVSPPDLALTLVDGAGKSARVEARAFTTPALPGKPVFHEIRALHPVYDQSGVFLGWQEGIDPCSVHRLATCAAPLAAFAGVDLRDVRSLQVSGPEALPQRVFIDSIALVKP
jgi:dienelactone hydrolase